MHAIVRLGNGKSYTSAVLDYETNKSFFPVEEEIIDVSGYVSIVPTTNLLSRRWKL